MTHGNEPMHPAMDFNQHADGSGNMELRYDGLTKREYFAAMAMQGLCANYLREGVTGWGVETYAVEAVALADALTDALNAPSKNINHE